MSGGRWQGRAYYHAAEMDIKLSHFFLVQLAGCDKPIPLNLWTLQNPSNYRAQAFKHHTPLCLRLVYTPQSAGGL